ncbi:hypothetical protein BDW66DRAFT_142950 [Aspergillus desertorum]
MAEMQLALVLVRSSSTMDMTLNRWTLKDWIQASALRTRLEHPRKELNGNGFATKSVLNMLRSIRGTIAWSVLGLASTSLLVAVFVQGNIHRVARKFP